MNKITLPKILIYFEPILSLNKKTFKAFTSKEKLIKILSENGKLIFIFRWILTHTREYIK